MVLKERKDLEFFLGSFLCLSFFFFFVFAINREARRGME